MKKNKQILIVYAEVMRECQNVELEIIAYLKQIFDLIRHELNNKVHFAFYANDYQEASLERLIRIFSKLSKNEKLIKRLNSFRKKRNNLVHKYLLTLEDCESSMEIGNAKKWIDHLKAIKKETCELQKDIRQELNKHLKYIY